MSRRCRRQYVGNSIDDTGDEGDMDIEKVCRRSYSGAIARVPFKLVFGESNLLGINRSQYTNQRGCRVSKSEYSAQAQYR